MPKRKECDELTALVTKKIEELFTLCSANRIPVSIICAIKTDDDNVKYISKAATPVRLGVDLKDDRITPTLALIQSGRFKISPLKEDEVYDESIYYPDEAE